MRNLSKSKLIAYRQCPKRLWLEIHKPDLRNDSASETIFQIGHQVGDIARSLYDPGSQGVLIDVGELGHAEALALSATLLAEGRKPVFEAGISIDGALAYADVMLPDATSGEPSWRMIEVKSSTGVKDYHHDDVAVQSYLAATAGVRVSSIAVAHIDNTFVYQGDGNYRGLLKEADLTAHAAARHDEVRQWIDEARAVAALEAEPDAETGNHCSKPFACGFAAYCNRDKIGPEFPLSSLPNIHAKKRGKLEAAGINDLRHVPDEQLSTLQRRVKQSTATGTAFFDAEGAAAALAPHGFPAHFLDYETAMLAIPIWKGTHPYQQLPFQFSLHVIEADQTHRHEEFLDLSGDDPRRAFAETLIQHCGDRGPIYVYNIPFERRITRELAGAFPDLAPRLNAIIDRLVDLLPVARAHYYHPSQHGSWSIKAVLPAAVPDLSYNHLEGIQDGGMAMAAFSEAISPATTPERKQEIDRQLRAYCHLDTLAMVRLWHFFSGRPLISPTNPSAPHAHGPDPSEKQPSAA